MLYQHRPTTVEAWQVRRGEALPHWLDGRASLIEGAGAMVDVWEGRCEADLGDFIVKGEDGTLSVMTAEAFASAYRLAEDH